MSMSCSCEGEGRGFVCEHAERLLDGDVSIILSRNVDELDDLLAAAWNSQFGQWISIRRVYCGETASVQKHLARASERFTALSRPRFAQAALPAPAQVGPPPPNIRPPLPLPAPWQLPRHAPSHRQFTPSLQ